MCHSSHCSSVGVGQARAPPTALSLSLHRCDDRRACLQATASTPQQQPRAQPASVTAAASARPSPQPQAAGAAILDQLMSGLSDRGRRLAAAAGARSRMSTRQLTASQERSAAVAATNGKPSYTLLSAQLWHGGSESSVAAELAERLCAVLEVSCLFGARKQRHGLACGQRACDGATTLAAGQSGDHRPVLRERIRRGCAAYSWGGVQPSWRWGGEPDI